MRSARALVLMEGAPWTSLGDPTFTFSESELVDVLAFVSNLTEGA